VTSKIPRAQTGIKAGDQVLAIDGKPGLDVQDASSLIRGKVGTPITLRIERQGRNDFEVQLTRANIELPSVLHTLKQEGNRRVGYIRMQEFSAHAAEQMQRAIQDLNHQQVDAFV